LWLAEIGYPVTNESAAIFRIPDDTGLLFLLEPMTAVTDVEWEAIDTWVEAGGTLILAGQQFGTLLAARHYDFRLDYQIDQPAELAAQTPLLQSPRLDQPLTIRPETYFTTHRDDFTVHLATEAGPVLVSFQKGDGLVVLSAAAFPFSNAGLKASGNPALVFNLVALAEAGAGVWFDEWHHNIRGSDDPDENEFLGPGNWLRYTPVGRAFLYVAVVIFFAIVLAGRRFGRPVPLPTATARRAPLEHISAIANLSRRAGHRRAVVRDYKHRLKRGLGQRYRLTPTLADDEYVKQLANLNPNLDAGELHALLTRLNQSNPGENELVELAREVARWLGD
jgi:hypothetical protein